MKIVLLLMAGLTIGALILIAAVQLIKVVIQELVHMAHEAWVSGERLHTDV